MLKLFYLKNTESKKSFFDYLIYDAVDLKF